jgi:hypothetical protein
MATPRRHHPKPLLWDRSDKELTSKQRGEKARYLHAESLARRHKANLEEALRHEGLNLSQTLRNTDAIKMRHGKLVPKVRDRIPRSMKVYEKGRLVHVEVANSKTASGIGAYWNAVVHLIEKRKSSAIRSLKRRRFKDINGHVHTLEKDPRIILELEARKPKPESFTIYKSR